MKTLPWTTRFAIHFLSFRALRAAVGCVAATVVLFLGIPQAWAASTSISLAVTSGGNPVTTIVLLS
jgi:hypothetical protein